MNKNHHSMKNSTKNEGKTNSFVLLALALLVLAGFTAVIYASRTAPSSVSSAEFNSHFDLADKNKDGSVTKEEFREYLEARKTAPVPKYDNVKICPKTGAPCSGGGCGGEGAAGGGCCSEGAKMESGCCKAKTTTLTGAKGGCCSEEAKTTKVAETSITENTNTTSSN